MAAVSVGDILQIITILTEVSTALLDCRGKSAECRAIVSELDSTRLALESVRTVTFDNPARLRALRKVTKRCVLAVKALSDGVDKYRPHLQPGGTKNKPLDLYRRVRFAYFVQNRDQLALREQIQTHVQAIQIIIQTAQFSEILARNRAAELPTPGGGLRRGFVYDLPAGDIAPVPEARFVTIENACGDRFKVSLQAVDSWKLLEEYLQRLPQSDAHRQKLAASEYLLRSQETNAFVAAYDPFNLTFKPGAYFEMSMVFPTSFHGRCPGCESRLARSKLPGSQVLYICQPCGLQTETIISEPDIIDPLTELMAGHGILDEEWPMADLLPDFVAHLVNLSWTESLDQRQVLREFGLTSQKNDKNEVKPADFRRVVLSVPQWPTCSAIPNAFRAAREATRTATKLGDVIPGVLESAHVADMARLQRDTEWRLKLAVSALCLHHHQFSRLLCGYRVLSWMVAELLSNIGTWTELFEHRLRQIQEARNDFKINEEARRLIQITWMSLLTSDLEFPESMVSLENEGDSHWLKVATVTSLCVKDAFGEAVWMQQQMLAVMILSTAMLEMTTMRSVENNATGRHNTFRSTRVYQRSDERILDIMAHNEKSPLWLFASNFTSSIRQTMDGYRHSMRDVAFDKIVRIIASMAVQNKPESRVFQLLSANSEEVDEGTNRSNVSSILNAPGSSDSERPVNSNTQQPRRRNRSPGIRHAARTFRYSDTSTSTESDDYYYYQKRPMKSPNRKNKPRDGKSRQILRDLIDTTLHHAGERLEVQNYVSKQATSKPSPRQQTRTNENRDKTTSGRFVATGRPLTVPSPARRRPRRPAVKDTGLVVRELSEWADSDSGSERGARRRRRTDDEVKVTTGTRRRKPPERKKNFQARVSDEDSERGERSV